MNQDNGAINVYSGVKTAEDIDPINCGGVACTPLCQVADIVTRGV